MKISLELDKDTNVLSFIFGDKEDDYNYIYNYVLDSISNINTLCIFFHNCSNLKIKKSEYNYLVVDKNNIEIKTDNSYVNQKSNVDIEKLHTDLIKLLYQNQYISYSINIVPSDTIKKNHKIKKSIINTEDLNRAKLNLKKVNTKQINITSNDFVNQKKNLKHVPKRCTKRYHRLYLTNDILEKQKILLKKVDHDSDSQNNIIDVSENKIVDYGNDSLTELNYVQDSSMIDNTVDYIKNDITDYISDSMIQSALDSVTQSIEINESTIDNSTVDMPDNSILYDMISTSSECSIECDDQLNSNLFIE